MNKMKPRKEFLLCLGVLSILLVQLAQATSTTTSISSYGAIDYSTVTTIYFPHTGEGDFEKFPFCRWGQQDWDWANGYQMDADGNLFAYSDSGTNPDVYIRQSTEHVQHGSYSAEFHLGEGTQGTHGSVYKHCKLYEDNQGEYPDSYLHPEDGQPEAYYSAWYWFPSDFAQSISSWRLIMQWADEESGWHSWSSGSCFPTLTLSFTKYYYDTPLRLCNNRFYREENPQEGAKYVRWRTGYTAENIPKEQWVHIVVFVKMSSGFAVLDGRATVWINDEKVLDVAIGLWNYWTYPKDVGVCWGIGNYGPKYNTGSIWIDNVQVSDRYVY